MSCKECLHAPVCGICVATGGRVKECEQFLIFGKEPGYGWIPTSLGLPEKDGSYIVRTTTGAVTTAHFYSAKVFPPTHYRPSEYRSTAKWQTNRNVTHWMPLPEPPKEVSDD
jgi:hypothetical protein